MILLFSDLDGTLEDSRADMANAVVATRQFFNLPVEASAAYESNVNKGMLELYRSCFADFITEQKKSGVEDSVTIDKIREQYETEYSNAIALNTKLYDGMKESMLALQKCGVRMAVITNKPEHLSRKLLGALGVLNLVEVIVGGDTCAECKPSAVPLKFAADKIGFAPELGDRAFMMGDTAADIQAAHAFGAHSIWCSWGYLSALPVGTTPEFVANNTSDIKKILFS